MAFITISRMYGSGGSEVAEQVAGALGWALFDNAMVDAVAARSGLTREEVTAREERVPGLIERLAAALSMGTPESMPPIPADPLPSDEEAIVAVTRRVIEEAVAAGPAVFVGRGAQCLLAGRDDALHVFCYAEQDALVRFAVAHLGVSQADAPARVIETNRQREQYVRRHWNREWRSPLNYDLCVNTGRLGVEQCAELIVQLARARLDTSTA
jgi:CMP/dCMP kinase